jgi:hypothetical protein
LIQRVFEDDEILVTQTDLLFGKGEVVTVFRVIEVFKVERVLMLFVVVL